MSTIVNQPEVAAAVSATNLKAVYLLGPVVDFLLLGGGSLIALAAVPFLWPKGADIAVVATTMMLLANVINHPHFANSYQLFYRDFKARAFGAVFPTGLRRKYLFAGLAVPVLLVTFLTYCVATGNPNLLGWASNLMFFLVGWHYVKQGYGMLMVDAVLKKNFFDEKSKKILLYNAYAVWITSWMLLNRTFSEVDYWEINYYSFAVPDSIFWSSIAITVATTLLVIPVFLRKIKLTQVAGTPINGMIAYVASLYIWLLSMHPAMLLVIPAFHSLQYLAVVWRYKLNMERGKTESKSSIWKKFALFLFSGFILGYVGFWLAPEWLSSNASYDRSVFGGSLFLFLFWVFINLHHYFLDNVMWRKDNPDTRKYLFGAS